MSITKAERTRAAILDAALEFLWSNPFRDMSVSLLMSSTTSSRSTFYQYFDDMHALMETLLVDVEEQILFQAQPWFSGDGDPVELLRESLSGLVKVGYERGPILRAVVDAAPTDMRLERSWADLLERFDQVVARRIEADQAQGLIPPFDAHPVAVALNRLDASTLIHAFGRRPRRRPEPVREAIIRIWASTLYGPESMDGLPLAKRLSASDPSS